MAKAWGRTGRVVIFSAWLQLAWVHSAPGAFVYDAKLTASKEQAPLPPPGLGREKVGQGGSGDSSDLVQRTEREREMPAMAGETLAISEDAGPGLQSPVPVVHERMAITSVHMNHGGAAPGTPVPEPGALAILSVAATGWMSRRRRQH